MSTLPDAQQPSDRPTAACLVCRRRKLKCSREPGGCTNCTRTDLPCVYPSAEPAIKRKRGPYKKKDRTSRERHIEHVVKYLSNPVTEPSAPSSPVPSLDLGSGSSLGSSTLYRSSARALQPIATSGSHATSSQNLVKDALIALTQIPAYKNETGNESAISSAIVSPPLSEGQQSLDHAHPPIRHVFELWQLFVARVDPLTKLVHCPTFVNRLFLHLDDRRPGNMDILAFSIYYAAVTSCSASETRAKFGESKVELLRRYGQIIEAKVAQSYDGPTLELMQGLLLYLVCLRRLDAESGLWALFSLAVRSAQMMGLHHDPGPEQEPYIAEMRRRCWWTLYSLESRRAEEGATKQDSLLLHNTVSLPANLNDSDLQPGAGTFPMPRNGITEMSYVLARWEIMTMTTRIWKMKRSGAEDDVDEDVTRQQQSIVYLETKERLESNLIRHCHESRPYDWFLMGLAEVMLTKARLIIQYPGGHLISNGMRPDQRHDILQASVMIICITHDMHLDPRAANWFWYFHGFVQWHSLAVVIAELGHCTDSSFACTAWALLAPILRQWESIYREKKHDSAWDHVNMLIKRAKHMAEQQHGTTQRDMFTASHDSPIWEIASSQAAYRPSTVAMLQSLPPPSDQSYGDQCNTDTAQVLSDDTPWPAILSGSRSMMNDMEIPTNLANLDNSFGQFTFSEGIDLNAMNAVFASPSWELAGPLGEFEMDIGV